ncbi:MAG TPA: O-methyltransferase [Thermoleophilaceae bacterium]|nr:O-methyltransferase [Thermoleophilaceae bacterium]
MDLVDPLIEDYALAHTSPFAGPLAEAARQTREEMPSPGMMTAVPEGRLLQGLITLTGARRVLEVGTFTGVGALLMAEALPDDGELITIERDAGHAAIARGHFEKSPLGGRITLIEGDAREEIERLAGPFDLVYIDAWKPDYEHYYEAAVPLLSPRGVIVADNVLLSGQVLDAGGNDSARGIVAFNERVQADERVHNVLLTVGDGLMLAWPA